MKKCPFCAEEIQDEAVKCRHCNEFIDRKLGEGKSAWYFSNTFLVIGLLSVGPVVLPLVWLNPRFGSLFKVFLTVLVLLVSWWIFTLTSSYFREIKEYYHFISQSI